MENNVIWSILLSVFVIYYAIDTAVFLLNIISGVKVVKIKVKSVYHGLVRPVIYLIGVISLFKIIFN